MGLGVPKFTDVLVSFAILDDSQIFPVVDGELMLLLPDGLELCVTLGSRISKLFCSKP